MPVESVFSFPGGSFFFEFGIKAGCGGIDRHRGLFTVSIEEKCVVVESERPRPSLMASVSVSRKKVLPVGITE